MTDSPITNEPDIEDRGANIRMTVQGIIDRKLDEMFHDFDRLHKRGIHDEDMIAALRYLGPIELLDDYAEWGEIDIREDDNTTLDPAVPDPGDAPSYEGLPVYAPVTPGHTRFYPEGGGILDIPDHLVETFRKGGAE